MLWWFAQTTLIAGALAVVATLAGRWKRLGPEARHALWLVVLIKLAIPPFVAWPWSVPDAWPSRVEPIAVPVASPTPPVGAPPAALEIPPRPPLDPPPVLGPPPSPEEVLASVEVAEQSRISTIPDFKFPESRPEARDPDPGPPPLKSVILNPRSEIPRSGIWTANSLLLALWLAGSVVVMARRGVKVARLHRSLSRSGAAPGWLVEEVRAIGERVGVRPPPVLSTPSLGTPLLWCLGRPRLILPEALIKRLAADRWPGILAHELAHLARRDHWVVRLELLVEAAWWWNPLFWHARRRLHEEAEIACDARVVRALPERRYAYAEALVDVCEHIARSAIPSPALGVGGAGASHSLEGRLLMILQDPIPHRPTRRASLVALLLVALALPAWTLGQQQEAPPPKPEAPPSKPEAPSTKPEEAARPPAAPPAEPAKPSPAAPASPAHPQSIKGLSPPIADLTIGDVRAGFAKRQESLKNLSMRYVVASRDRPANVVDGRPQAVGVQVADVVLDFGADPVSNYRLDVLSALANPERPNPGEPPVPWSRRFVAREVAEIVTFPGSWSQAGPVPFRRQPAGEHLGDDLTAALCYPTGQDAVDRNRSVDPLEPRPANVLDLAGAAALLLGPGDNPPGRLDVAGVDVVEGREVLRVAWVGNRDDGRGGGGLRGLLWIAPSLRFAVVRSEATQDPSQVEMTHGRRTWRKTAGDFTEVDGLWLPRKVEIHTTEANFAGAFAGASPPAEHELAATFEDYRVNPELPPDTFHPKLKIEALDEKTGDFTTLPPKPSPGLVDRLAKAVLESKFGPPADEKPDDMPPAPKPPTPKPPTPINPPGARVIPPPGDALPKRAVRPATPKPDAAKIDPGIIAKPAAGSEDPIPISEPKKDDPSPAKPPAPVLPPPRAVDDPTIVAPKDLAKPAPAPAGPAAEPGKAKPIPAMEPTNEETLSQLIERRFRMDPEVRAHAAQMAQAQHKLVEIQRIAGRGGDASEAAVKRKLADLEDRYNKLWETKSGVLRMELEPLVGRARDEVELLQIRRNRKAAEVRKAEAGLELARAVVQRNETLQKKGPQYVSREEVLKAEAEGKVAEAEVAGKTSELEEADLLLKQARRRLGIVTPDGPVKPESPKAIRDGEAPDPEAAPDGRDEVGLFQARRDGQAAELKKADAGLELARQKMQRASNLQARNAIGRQELDQASADLKVAEADVARKKADLDEADVLLNQARRRPGAAPTSNRGSSATTGQAATLPELRDAVELMEIQLQGKQAELRGVEGRLALAKSKDDQVAGLRQKGGISQGERDLSRIDLQVAQAELDTKKAEVLESEVRLKQARRRVEAHEARLRREVERLKGRLDWSEGMFKKGYVSQATFLADRAAYDELMIQLDPKYVPAPIPATPPGDVPASPTPPSDPKPAPPQPF